MAAAIWSTSPAMVRPKNRRSAARCARAASVTSAACSLPRSAWAIAWSASARVDVRRRRRRFRHITHPCLQPFQQGGGLLGGRYGVVGALALDGEGAAELVGLGAGRLPCLVPFVGFGFDAVGVGLGGDDADEEEDDDDG